MDEVTIDEQLGTLSERAYLALRADILLGRLRPGAGLRSGELRNLYGIGLTPLREALSRLSGEGMVTVSKGFRVAGVSCRELGELCELRILIESEALRRSTRFGDSAWEGQVVAAFYQLDRIEQRFARGEMPDTDERKERYREFHSALVAKANSKSLLRLRSQLLDHFERYRRDAKDARFATPSREVAREHREMMEAALSRRGDDLAAIMASHINGILDLLRHGDRGSEARRAAAPSFRQP